MKRQAVNVLIAAIITWLFSLTVSTVLTYVTQSNLSILIGAPNKTETNLLVPLTVTNYTNDTLNDLILSIPYTTDISKITSSTPIDISLNQTNSGNSKIEYITISKISPNKVTNLIIPINDFSESQYINIINLKQKNITLLTNDLNESPLDRALSSGLQLISIYTVFFAIYLFIILTKMRESEEKQEKAIEKITLEFNKDKEKLENAIEKAEKHSNDQHQHMEHVAKDLEDTKVAFSKAQILLLARLTDYSKELIFWRDTIRKMLYESTDGKLSGDLIIKKVTECLKTYGTISGDETEFHTIETMARLISTDQKK